MNKVPKEDMRAETARLMEGFAGQITRCPTKTAGGSDDKLFANSRQAVKETRAKERAALRAG